MGWGEGGGGIVAIDLSHVGAASRKFVKFNDNVTQLTLWPNIYDFNVLLRNTQLSIDHQQVTTAGRPCTYIMMLENK